MHYRYKTEEWSGATTTKVPSDALAEFIEKLDREGWELFSVHLENTTGSHYRLVFRTPAPEINRITRFVDRSKSQDDTELLLANLASLNGAAPGFTVKEVIPGEKIAVSVPRGCTVEVTRNGKGVLYVGEKGRSNEPVDVGHGNVPEREIETPLDALVKAIIDCIVKGSPGLLDP